MKDPSKIYLPSDRHSAKRSEGSPDRLVKSRRGAGMGGWRALERRQFRTLIAAPLPRKTHP
jgi:hypothetical protein